MSRWMLDQTKILSRGEIARVIDELKRKGKRSRNTRQNLIIFRLATCCGLRVSEVVGLRLSDVRLGLDRPYIKVPNAIAKRKRGRRVPLWWDRGTLDDLTAWKGERIRQGAKPADPFVCSQANGTVNRPMRREVARHRFIRSCGILGPERRREVTIHTGRHSFVSHALAGGRSLAEVRNAAGHASIATTSVYLHVAVDDDGAVGELFEFAKVNGRTQPSGLAGIRDASR
jgi:integrase